MCRVLCHGHGQVHGLDLGLGIGPPPLVIHQCWRVQDPLFSL